MKINAISAVMLLIASAPVFAASVGVGSGFDQRIQRTQYNAEDVTKILVKKGTVSVVQFSDDEKIEGIGLGDPAAWNVSVTGNKILFRPTVDDNPDTNVAVLTDKRSYSLFLSSTRNAPTYFLKFIYPAPPKPLAAKVAKKIPCTNGNMINGHYQIRGSAGISPYQIWDDGQFTCMRWGSTKDLPIVYRKNIDGKEMLVNTHMEKNTMVIHEHSENYVLRLGDAVLDVRTNSSIPRHYNAAGSSNREQREDKPQ